MNRLVPVDHGLIFYPRGGSALVAKNLTEQLRVQGRPARVFAGSLGEPGEYSHAPTFYGPAHLVASDYNLAATTHAAGLDPLEMPVPLHPSYEDRPGVPDRVFAAVSPRTNAHLEDYWTRQFADHGAGEGGLLHLHHLTPQHTAARRLERTVVTTLHGTDLKFLQGALDRVSRAAATSLSVAELARREEMAGDRTENPPDERWRSWAHAEFWIQTLREHAQSSEHIVTVSEQDRALAHELLHIPEDRLEVIPNGVDTNLFQPHPTLDDTGKRTLLHRWLVEEPQGWLPGHGPGTITYTHSDVDRMLCDDAGNRRPLLLWMGRFLDFKRLDLLLHVFAALKESAPVRPALLVLGGFPGEWEGEHPHTLAERLGIGNDVYFAGWRPHGDLIDGLNASDLFVTPSVDEPFGLVCLEAMASATPVVATASGGPLATIRTHGPRPTGWLTVPGDAEDLHATLLEALTRPGEIERRGRHARDFVVQHYSWRTITDRYGHMYDRVLASIRA
ncbi:glycosyltransferase [Kitasatospora sp. NPDC097643]|uniref:glycosyltransferase n=1 Tax=Kitasatospora sp. NPDC097643 TaxID=3157230 RepID=UPI0033349287